MIQLHPRVEEATAENKPESLIKALCALDCGQKRSAAELRAALKDSLKEEEAGKGRGFDGGREAIWWLES